MSKVPEFEKVKCETQDLAKQNLEKLKALFPGVVTEGPDGVAIDVEALKQECSATPIEGNVERYEFTWPGKRAAKAAASTATNKTLRPCRAESVNFDTTENLYIEGDNLEVLKLLQTNYAGKVKMIYIDPPYNTGHDFVYRDRFSLTQKELESDAGAFDDDGNRFEVNDSSEARYHSNWCSMMYPRLKLARQLLTDDGVMFISLDGNEVTNIHKICDEVFGSKNFVTDIIAINNPRGRQSDSFVATVHENLVIYARDIDECVINGMPLSEEQKNEYGYTDDNGAYRLLGLRQRGVASLREDRPDMYFPIYVNPTTLEVSLDEREGWTVVTPKKSDGRDGRWMWGAQKCRNEISRLIPRLIERRNEFDVFVKDYLVRDGEARTRKYKSVWDDNELNNQVATQEVKALLGGEYMSFPKSRYYIEMISQLGSDKDSIVLDFFSGSATTAHAVMQLNAEDGGNRKFIMVQLPEPCAEDSEAAKAGYKNICEIGKERIRRAGMKILTQSRRGAENGGVENGGEEGAHSDDLFAAQNLRVSASPRENKIPDIGFRVLKLDSSSLEDASETASGTQQQMLGLSRIKEDRTSEDLLFQILLESKLSLSESIVRDKVEGNEVFFVGVDTACAARPPYHEAPLVACLDARAKMTEKFFTALAKLQPALAFFRDDLFESDSARINLAQIFKQFSPNTTITVI